jgi:hypothetical protein
MMPGDARKSGFGAVRGATRPKSWFGVRFSLIPPWNNDFGSNSPGEALGAGRLSQIRGRGISHAGSALAARRDPR